jgi:hypothetical protein
MATANGDHIEGSKRPIRKISYHCFTSILAEICSIAPYLLMNFGPQISVLGENNITTLTSFDTPVLVAHISTADEDSAKIFNEAASSLLKEERFVFGTTASSKLAGIEDDFELPFVALYNPSDEAKPTYHGLFDPESIAKFALQAASTPLIGRFNLESLAAYADVVVLCPFLFHLLTLPDRSISCSHICSHARRATEIRSCIEAIGGETPRQPQVRHCRCLETRFPGW